MSFTWAAIVAVVITTVAGDLLVSRAMKKTGDLGLVYAREGLRRTVVVVATNGTLWAGVAAMALSFFSLLWALSWADLSLVAPAAAALTFIGNALTAKVFLHEDVNLRRWMAAVLVAAGVVLVTR